MVNVLNLMIIQIVTNVIQKNIYNNYVLNLKIIN